jgi:hypothetical protein
MHQAGSHSDELSLDARAEMEEDVEELLDRAADWPVGTILERRPDEIQPRAES